MENKVLEDIKNYAINKLKQNFGYCGAAEGANSVFINSGSDGRNITIKIDIEEVAG
jgi:hypothetical protein